MKYFCLYICFLAASSPLNVSSKVALSASSSGSSSVLDNCWSNMVWECGLHIPWENCYVLHSPPTVRQELSNYTCHFIHLQSVVSTLLLLLTWSLGKPQFSEQFLIVPVGVISFQFAAAKCIADSTTSIVCAASRSSQFSVTVTAFGMLCFYHGT